MTAPAAPVPHEEALVARARGGDRRAFEALYRAHAGHLYAWVLVPMLGDRDDAEECLRETFLAAHRALGTYQWKEPGIWPWLKTLAKNKARDHLRAAGRRSRLRGSFSEHLDVLGEALDRGGSDATAVRAELRRRIDAVLGELQPRQAEVLRLRLLEDRDREECARILEVQIGNLDVILFRAVRAFRAAWAARHPEGAEP